MRVFFLLCCIAATYADQLGYNYQPVSNSPTVPHFTPGLNSVGSGFSAIGSLRDGDISQGGNGGIGSSATSLGNLGGNVPSYNTPSYDVPVELEKEFYTFSAPENEFDDRSVAQRIAGSVKRGLRVIFIKGAENNGLENAAIHLAKQAAEQKTAIYVLNKQTDIGDLANKLNVINQSNNNKPEVHFVKYRTPEDAISAQNAIQSQYDSLGGTSVSQHGGVAPVLNFASQSPVDTGPAKAPGNAYLPSSVVRS